jgi:hypothetical protein
MHVCSPLSPQSDNFFKFKVMRNRVGPKNLPKSRLTPFILSNILASMTGTCESRSDCSRNVLIFA